MIKTLLSLGVTVAVLVGGAYIILGLFFKLLAL